MASSSAVACIQSVLNRFLGQISPWIYVRGMVVGLRHLKTFHLCARKWTNHDTSEDASLLESFLEATLDEVIKIEKEVLRMQYEPLSKMECYLLDWMDRIKHLDNGVNKWYVRLSDCSRFSSSLTSSQVVEIIHSLRESVEDFGRVQGWNIEGIIQALENNLSFFQNFIRFSTMQCVELDHREMEDLFTPIEIFTISAARLIASFPDYPSERGENIWSDIKVLRHKIKPSDPRFCETYIQALTRSKLSSRMHTPTTGENHDPIFIMKNFTDSLLWILWETLQLESRLVFFEKDQLQLLYEGLRLLRTIFKERPNKIDDKIRDVIRAVICDGGVIMFSLSLQKAKVELELQDLLERIKAIWAEVEGTVPGTSTVIFPNTNELSFMDFLLESLVQLTRSKPDSTFQGHVQIIQEELVFLRSFLAEIVELRDQQEELQTLWNRVIEVAHMAEFLIDHLVHGDASNFLATSFDCITKDIIIIKSNALKIFYNERRYIKLKMAPRISSHLPSQRSAPVTDGVVGFDNEATSIIDRLTQGSKKRQIVAVVGMPGSGKTTLAMKVYNDSKVMRHFQVRALCTISQVFDKKKVLLELLEHIFTNLPSEYCGKSEDDLALALRRNLLRRKYIILLDDTWDIKAWNSLEASFPNDSNGSRILLTSRHRHAAPQNLLDKEPLSLGELTNDESWELLQKKLFPENTCPPELWELGMKIAKRCKGLPLTVVVVAGLLAMIEPESWNGVLQSGIVSSTEQCMNSLELSYRHLPDYLKPCLLYFGAFPEDEQVRFDRLIWLWIAEGFVQKSESRSLEDVAKDQLTELIGRSLVMVAQRGSLGSVKACRVHDLVRDFCLKKSKEEIFFQLLKGYDELSTFHEPCYMRRLSIHSEQQHFANSRLFCPRVRSLLFFAQTKLRYDNWCDVSFVIHLFNLLRVLDILQIHMGWLFPSEVGCLVQLRYLAVSGYIEVMPSTIGNLSNLETFIVHSNGIVTLPDTLWNLQKLRHIEVLRWVEMPVENLEKYSNLHELDSLSRTIIMRHNVERQLRKFPNLRKLRCRLKGEYGCKQVVAPDFLTRLESLSLSSSSSSSWHSAAAFAVIPPNLRKLSLVGYDMKWSEMSTTIGKLPNLEVLKLRSMVPDGDTWDMEEEGELFSKLRVLKLVDLNLVRWKASDDQIPNLQKLQLVHCRSLQELPSCLENITTLEMIEIRDCGRGIKSSVKKIQKAQMGWGNSGLKILAQYWNDCDDGSSDESDEEISEHV